MRMGRGKRDYGTYGEGGTWKGKIIWNVNKNIEKMDEFLDRYHLLKLNPHTNGHFILFYKESKNHKMQKRNNIQLMLLV